ncbi:MAG: class I SAM-dependent methyltransferase, partial [bacterium]|nr:class I SAM-dependent methyltransferase [bacterium]
MPGQNDPYKSQAETYDSNSVEYEWYGPQVLFGLMYRHIKPEQSLLDLGIGTGLGSLPFHKAGLVISGMDSSQAMLDQCRKKALGFQLTWHDLETTPWPFEDQSFDHVISTGVFHFVGDLRGIFSEVGRVIKGGGTFGFDVDEYTPDTAGEYERASHGVYTRYDEAYDVRLFRHSGKYLFEVFKETGFEMMHDLE